MAAHKSTPCYVDDSSSGRKDAHEAMRYRGYAGSYQQGTPSRQEVYHSTYTSITFYKGLAWPGLVWPALPCLSPQKQRRYELRIRFVHQEPQPGREDFYCCITTIFTFILSSARKGLSAWQQRG